ncbi:MAG: hypothetical protein ACRD5F_08995 [Candidatus Acidiferrales bacterium]
MRVLALSVLILFTAAGLRAQQPPLAAEPSPPDQQARAAQTQRPLPPKPEPPSIAQQTSHRFWDSRNKKFFAGVFAVRALDFASTLNMRARGRDEILLTNEVVDNKPAFAAIELGATAASIGVSYWLHRKGHHKLERWVSILHISIGGFGAVRNYMLETRRPAPGPATISRRATGH